MLSLNAYMKLLLFAKLCKGPWTYVTWYSPHRQRLVTEFLHNDFTV